MKWVIHKLGLSRLLLRLAAHWCAISEEEFKRILAEMMVRHLRLLARRSWLRRLSGMALTTTSSTGIASVFSRVIELTLGAQELLLFLEQAV